MTIFKEGGVLRRGNEMELFAKQEQDRIASEEAAALAALPEEVTEAAFFESVDDDLLLESVSKAAELNARANAAAAVVQWISDGDAEFEALDAIVHGLASDEDAEELDDDEYEDYQEIMAGVSEFAEQKGAPIEKIQLMAEDDAAAEAVFSAIESALKGKSTNEAVADFSVRENLIMEATKKVIRGGKVKLIKTKRKKRKLNAAQKAALKKARRKANTSAAKAKRSKAMRQRKSRGM